MHGSRTCGRPSLGDAVSSWHDTFYVCARYSGWIAGTGGRFGSAGVRAAGVALSVALRTPCNVRDSVVAALLPPARDRFSFLISYAIRSSDTGSHRILLNSARTARAHASAATRRDHASVALSMASRRPASMGSERNGRKALSGALISARTVPAVGKEVQVRLVLHSIEPHDGLMSME